MGDAKHMDNANAKPSYAYTAAGDHANVSRPRCLRACCLTASRRVQVATVVAAMRASRVRVDRVGIPSAAVREIRRPLR